jgi:hypothetical protein
MSGAPDVAPKFSSMSFSTAELNLNSLMSVQVAFPDASDGDAAWFLDRISAVRRYSGYILASGREEN